MLMNLSRFDLDANEKRKFFYKTLRISLFVHVIYLIFFGLWPPGKVHLAQVVLPR